jgi:hypothetical protein
MTFAENLALSAEGTADNCGLFLLAVKQRRKHVRMHILLMFGTLEIVRTVAILP